MKSIVKMKELNIHLTLKGVYHYRNRWSCGICAGELNLNERTFKFKKKQGIFQIHERSDILKFLNHPEDSLAAPDGFNQFGIKEQKINLLKIILGDYCTLEQFLKLHVNLPDKEPKYLANLILKNLNVKKLWVARYSPITKWYRYRDVQRFDKSGRVRYPLYFCVECGLEYTTHKPEENLCSICKAAKIKERQLKDFDIRYNL